MSGFSNQVTVSMPSMPWKTTSASSTSANHTLTPGSRRARMESTAMHDDDQSERARGVAMDHLHPGLAHVGGAWRSAPREPVGATCPKHPGQSGQPRPESDRRV